MRKPRLSASGSDLRMTTDHGRNPKSKLRCVLVIKYHILPPFSEQLSHAFFFLENPLLKGELPYSG